MEVIDHGPQFWFLLREGGEEYLSVRIQKGLSEFSMLVQLTLAERATYQVGKNAYAESLAIDVSNNPDRYQERDKETELGSWATQTIVAWRTAREYNQKPTQ